MTTQYNSNHINVRDYFRKLEGNPTVKTNLGFNSISDAKVAYNAMKGFTTTMSIDLIDLFANRTNVQRQEIAENFEKIYNKKLLDEVENATSGDYKDLMTALLKPTLNYYVSNLRLAIEKKKLQVLIELICTAPSHFLIQVRNYYCNTYGELLEHGISDVTCGDFQTILLLLINGYRESTDIKNDKAAVKDANALYQAGVARLGTVERVFVQIFCHRNFEQLKLVAEKYEIEHGHSLKKAVEKEFSGDCKIALLAILQSVQSPGEFFATVLYQSMKGFGTRNDDLIRVIVNRSEIDMVEIKNSFESLYGKSLKSFIADDTSGDYKKGLLALISD